jgi:hypothetical protein
MASQGQENWKNMCVKNGPGLGSTDDTIRRNMWTWSLDQAGAMLNFTDRHSQNPSPAQSGWKDPREATNRTQGHSCKGGTVNQGDLKPVGTLNQGGGIPKPGAQTRETLKPSRAPNRGEPKPWEKLKMERAQKVISFLFNFIRK